MHNFLYKRGYMAKNNFVRSRRIYNRLVANQTLEDFSLRYTASSARQRSHWVVAGTALGSISFLALEFIGAIGAINYGFNHLLIALLIFIPVAFIINLPISWYAAKYHVDIDLLTRGAGFGYIGSTITSLIYAIFTFVFYAFEATIMAKMWELTIGLNIQIAYIISSLVIIPLILYGIKFISKLQIFTQPVWVILQFIAVVSVCTMIKGENSLFSLGTANDFNPLFLGATLSLLLSLVSQIGEQVDYLRFMPTIIKPQKSIPQYLSYLVAGPGWVFIGALKILLGGILAIILIARNIPFVNAIDPNHQYFLAFSEIIHNKTLTIIILIVFVLLSQIKINVTNGYAGSIAWSNFFSRLTHTHPGRVVWVVFNVVIAYILILFDVYKLSLAILQLYAILSMSWCCSITADLIVNKPLKLSPKGIEFKRALLYDINPVGTISMFSGIIVGLLSYSGSFGPTMQAFAPIFSGGISFVLTPIIACITKGKYYIARQSNPTSCTCVICNKTFDIQDMCHCPVYKGNICSLCCTLESVCHDSCKPEATIQAQVQKILPTRFRKKFNIQILNFIGLMTIFTLIITGIILLVYHSYLPGAKDPATLKKALIGIFLLFEIIVAIFSWLYLLVNESRNMARKELNIRMTELENEVIEHKRTASLLEKAKNDADAANLAKTRYLSGISHELRTPLNTIMGYAQLLEMNKNVSPDIRKCLTSISRSSEYLSSLIEGLLHISRIEAGRLVLKKQDIRLQELFQEMVDYFTNEADKKSLLFSYNCHSRLPAIVTGDEKQFKQILINILSNAIKYTNNGQVSMDLKYSSEIIKISIKDTGIGIKQEDLQKIFKPFERLMDKNSTASGTGLGLTITNLLVTVMGGDLQVNSTYGEGSEFILKLRLPTVQWTIESEDKAPANIIGYVGQETHKYNIVITDDNQTHREILGERLIGIGFNVNYADCYENGIAKVTEHNPDLVFLDITMPHHTGWELLQKIRKDGFKKPVVMVSAEASEGNVPNYLKNMYNGYIVKPYKFNKIFDAISTLLDINWITSDSNINNSPTINLNNTNIQAEKPKIINKNAQMNDPIEHSNKDSIVDQNSKLIEKQNEQIIQNDQQHILPKFCEKLSDMLDIGFVKGIQNEINNLHIQQFITDEQHAQMTKLNKNMKFEEIKKFLEQNNEQKPIEKRNNSSG